jgi:hypothetical protein
MSMPHNPADRRDEDSSASGGLTLLVPSQFWRRRKFLKKGHFWMETIYQKIIKKNLQKAYHHTLEMLENTLPAHRNGDHFYFRAFGQDCIISRDGIYLDGNAEFGPKGIVISLYCCHGNSEKLQIEPFQSFKDFPNSMPYQGAFVANSERILVPLVPEIKRKRTEIKALFRGYDGPPDVSGDFSFVLYALPKVALCYIFYLPDEEFPASVTCLFSANAGAFLPLDGLADVAEYTSREIIRRIKDHR